LDLNSRVVTLLGAQGNALTLKVGDEVSLRRFDRDNAQQRAAARHLRLAGPTRHHGGKWSVQLRYAAPNIPG
jgi:hypothetical protein